MAGGASERCARGRGGLGGTALVCVPASSQAATPGECVVHSAPSFVAQGLNGNAGSVADVAGHSCKPDSRRLRKCPRCTRWAPVASLTRTAHGGLNKVSFSGSVARRPLHVGHYRAVFTARGNGLASPPQTLSFTIVAR